MEVSQKNNIFPAVSQMEQMEQPIRILIPGDLLRIGYFDQRKANMGSFSEKAKSFANFLPLQAL